jgi:hypothetical protein
VIKKPLERGGYGPRWAAVPEKIIIIYLKNAVYAFNLKYTHQKDN